MKKIVKNWDNVKEEWKMMPVEFRDKIREIYESNTRLKFGKTFTVGKTLTNAIPQLIECQGVTYNWMTWEYVAESWETK